MNKLAATSLLALPLIAAGCDSGIGTVTLTSLSGYATTAASTQIRHGPTVTLVNRSDTVVQARIWVAKVDASKPAGYSDQRTEDRLNLSIEPDQLLFVNAGRRGWLTGMNDAVVWIRLIPAAAERPVETPVAEPVWFAFDRPGPYKIEIAGAVNLDQPDAGLTYHPLEETTFQPLPRSLWIERWDGEYPVADSD